MQSKIIRHLNRHWNSQNVFFGKIIHELKPKTKTEWIEFLKTQKFYFTKNLSDINFKSYEHKYWIYYLANSFWKLYVSENKAIEFYKTKGIELKFADRYLDGQYGIDFLYKCHNQTYYLIVKHGIYDLDNLANFKRQPDFNNLMLFDSATNDVYRFHYDDRCFYLQQE